MIVEKNDRYGGRIYDSADRWTISSQSEKSVTMIKREQEREMELGYRVNIVMRVFKV